MAPSLGTVARICRKNKHTKTIVILDNVIPHEGRLGDKMLTGFMVNSADGFIAMSKSVEQDLRKFTTTKPCYLNPHPLFDNFGEPISKEKAKSDLNLDPKYNYLLFFGFIRAYKGLDLLIEALADEQLSNLPLKLLIAGEFYEDPKPYWDLINKHGLEDRVILSNDYIDNADVAKYFCASDLVVQPYKSATQSGVTQIGYHFNKPMIVTDVGGLSEIIPHGKTGFVVNTDPPSIASAISEFYSSNLEKEFSRNAAEEKKKYSWEAMYEKIVDLYKELS